MAELHPSGGIKSRFVYASQSHSSDYMIYSNGVETNIKMFFVKNHIGSILAVVDEHGFTRQALDYDEFGLVLSDTNPGFQPFGFAGGHYDHDTGLVRFGVRDYDAEIGKWTQADPIGFDGGDTNLYAYVNNDPINKIDPSGKFEVHGNWCGGDWTGGEEEEYKSENASKYKKPVDKLDQACKDHDICYSDCRKNEKSKCEKRNERAQCFKQCDVQLGDEAKKSSGKAAFAVEVAMKRPGSRNPGISTETCTCKAN